MNPTKSICSAWRFGVIALAVVCAGMTGCATFLASEMDSRDPEFHSQPLVVDKLIAIGKLDQKGEQVLEIPGGLVFLGEKQSYLIVKGGAELQAIAKSSIGPDVEILASYYESYNHLYIQDQKFWGEVALRASSGKGYPPEQQAELDALGFVKNEQDIFSKGPDVYRKTIALEGVVMKPIDVPANIVEHLTHSRSIAFYPPSDQKAPLNPGKYVVLPFAVAVDVVTAPIQILGFGAILLIIEAQGGLKIGF